MSTQETSLRERSKAKRRAAIQRAAMRLFAERGFDGATIADIAEEAELAPRTVTLYFPTKIEIAMSISSDLNHRLADTFHANPGLSFTEVIDRWLVSERNSTDADVAALTTAMLEANPSLRAMSAAHVSEATGLAGPAFLAELGLPDDHPLVAIVGAAVGAAIVEYLATAPSTAATSGTHETFVRCLRAIIAAARPD